MIRLKLTMEDDLGRTIEISQEYLGELGGRNLNEIEDLISEVKESSMRQSESELLELNSGLFREKKKKRA